MHRFRIFLIVLAMLVLMPSFSQAADNSYDLLNWSIEEQANFNWLPVRLDGYDSQTLPHCENISAMPACFNPDADSKCVDKYECSNKCAQYNSISPDAPPPFLSSIYWVEPRIDSNYRIVLENTSCCRMAVVASIDGLNTLGAGFVKGNVSDAVWILDPGETGTIDGWVLNRDLLSDFEWGALPLGYAEPTDRAGVIELHVFLEQEIDDERLTNEDGVVYEKVKPTPAGGRHLNSLITPDFIYTSSRCPMQTVRIIYSKKVYAQMPTLKNCCERYSERCPESYQCDGQPSASCPCDQPGKCTAPAEPTSKRKSSMPDVALPLDDY